MRRGLQTLGLGVAAAARVRHGRFEDVRIVLGGVASVPWPVHAAVRPLRGGAPDAQAIVQAARAALEGAEPLRMNGYKVPLAEALVRRALHALAA